jgi:hypothetical protein
MEIDMTADSRTVHTDALETLGMVHTSQQHRDAIHLGVEPVVAGMDLVAGTHVFLENGKAYSEGVRTHAAQKLVGIVDPFLKVDLEQGDRFWLVVYPRQITSLRHVWEHPDFPTDVSGKPASTADGFEFAPPTAEQLHQAAVMFAEPKAMALEWIRKYAAELSREADDDGYGGGVITPDDLIDTAMSNIGEHSANPNHWFEYLTRGGTLEGVSTSPEFWEKLAILKGIDIPQSERNNFFSCSC